MDRESFESDAQAERLTQAVLLILLIRALSQNKSQFRIWDLSYRVIGNQERIPLLWKRITDSVYKIVATNTADIFQIPHE